MAITSKEATIKQLSEEVFQLKSRDERKIQQVTALVRVRQGIELTGKEIPYTTPIVFIDTLLPSFRDSTEHYKIAGQVQPAGIRIDTLAVYDTLSFRIAEKKAGLFKRETVIQTVHSNPYYHTLGTQVITLKHKPSAWNRWIKPALFFSAGVFIQSKL